MLVLWGLVVSGEEENVVGVLITSGWMPNS